MTSTGKDRSARPGGTSDQLAQLTYDTGDRGSDRPGGGAQLARLRAEALHEISGLIAGGQDHAVAARWDDYTREALRALAASP